MNQAGVRLVQGRRLQRETASWAEGTTMHLTFHCALRAGATRPVHSKLFEMASTQLKVKGWVRAWILYTIPFVLYDIAFVLGRPHTMEGGAIHAFWTPYEVYTKVDPFYSEARYLSGDRFAEAQSILNIAEVGLQVLVLLLLAKGPKNEPAAVLVAFSGALLTFWKTVLYFMYDLIGDRATSAHVPWVRWIFMYIILDGLWVVVPFFVAIDTGAQLLRLVNSTANKQA